MTTHTMTQSDHFLRRVLQADGAVTGLTGLFLLIANGAVRDFMGLESSALVITTGIAFIIYEGLLFWIAAGQPVDANKVYATIALNTVWVLGSIALVVADPLAMTVEGKWLVGLVAVVAGLFADFQYYGIRRMTNNQ